ncbi:MAG: CRISPR-associated protein Csa2 [Thermococcaceae archaeon]|nr:CRISPR-associated protein Csa2 [Thermococcaceae archaeon]
MFLSVGVRFEANVEALNMVETAGNYGKHRRVPYLVEEDGKLKTVYVPAVSGESLGHAYQEHLVRESLSMSLPVCDDCHRGEFYKSMNKVHLQKKVNPIPEDPKEIEAAIVRACVVEDVGGFLYAEKPPVRRTSAFQVSYALPVKSVALFATSEPQLHARHAQMDASSKKGNASTSPIYDDYVEKTQKRLKILERFKEGYRFIVATGEKVPEEALGEAIDYLHERGAF